MSQKITSKNLAYTSKPPPFLARMQAQAAGQLSEDGTPSQSNQRNRRLGKKRSDSEEAEDEPVVVDEFGNEVQVGDVEAEAEKVEGDSGRVGEKGKGEDKKEDVGIGGRKRKGGRVVGGEEGDEGGKDDGKGREGVESGKGKRKKVKKIKLSFDEEEEG